MCRCVDVRLGVSGGDVCRCVNVCTVYASIPIL